MSKIYVFSGAGVSAESGISTWRGSDGLWETEKISEVCDISTWKNNFQQVHNFYNSLRERLRWYKPNAFHAAITELSEQYEVINMTQNIDDLFERAAFMGEVVHLHGELTRLRCLACGHRWDVSYLRWDTKDTCPNQMKHCQCRNGIKPDVVFFGEAAPQYTRLYQAIREITPEDIVVVAGTSNQVVQFDSHLFDRPGRKIWMNLEYPKSDIYDEYLIGPAGEQANALLELVKSHGSD